MSDAAEPVIETTSHPQRLRYEITVDGEVAGFSQYADRRGVRTFVHTEIADRFEGMGLASRLIHDALEDVRTRGITIVAQCPFVRSYVERHPEVADLLAPEDGGAR
jgi:predicted GNAT family acetyltransferase